jgi:hypothetical protein
MIKTIVSILFLSLAANAQLVNPVKDSNVVFTDITTNNASASKHGYLPKLDNTGLKYLRDDGTWQTVTAGISSLGLLDAGVASVSGANVSGSTLYMQSASSTMPGIISLGAQTLSGDKTISLLNSSTSGTLTNTGIISGGRINSATVSGSAVSDSTIVVLDTGFTVADDSTPSKKFQFNLSPIGANTTRTWLVPNASDTFVGETGSQTLTNKNVSGTTANSINTFDGSSFSTQHSGGKRLQWNVDTAASNTTVILSIPSASATIAATDVTQTWAAIPNLNAGLTASGTITLNNNVAPVSGKGIDFSATSNAALSTSEVLNDYDFGIVSSTLYGTTTSGTATYSASWGSYVKIGRLVHYDSYTAWTSFTGSGNLRLSLPFNSSNINANYKSGCKIGYVDSLSQTASTTLAGLVQNNSAYIDMQTLSASGSGTALPVDPSGFLNISCEYIAD